METALFINGVYEETLAEILEAQGKSPKGPFYLQPYSSEKIKLLSEASPSANNPTRLYLSLTNLLEFVSFSAEIIGWFDKREIGTADLNIYTEHLKKHQPSEKEIYLKNELGKACVNLIQISNLVRLQPTPVSCFIKISDNKPLARRTRSGGWSYVNSVPSWLGKTGTELHADVQRNLALEVKSSLNDSAEARKIRLSKATKMPAAIQVISQAFRRNPDVIAEVLSRAEGVCEQCKERAPFIRASNNSPYLEVHHLKPLAQGGEDTVENAIALCPNCHRESHFGEKSEKQEA
jgi:5-methylcytosine-specific restriction protein A